MKGKQLELFSVDDMYGCIGVEDEMEAISVAAYLWAIRLVSELDNEKYRIVKKVCDAVKIGEDEYFIPFVSGSMNIDKLVALRDCLNMREHAVIGEKYVHHYSEVCCRPHVSNPYAFVMARKAFKEYFGKEFQKNGWWITNMNLRQLTKIDLYEDVLKNERCRYARFPWPKNDNDGI